MDRGAAPRSTRAIEQARRAEAQQLFALGQLEDERNPTLAFAYALAAFERADTRDPSLRDTAALEGSIEIRPREGSNEGVSSLAFSPDGEWLVDSGTPPRMWKRDGSGPQDIPGSFSGFVSAHFAGDGRKLALFGRRNPAAAGIDVLDLPGLTRLEQIETPGEVLVAVRGDRLISVMPRIPNGSGADIVLRSFAGGDPESSDPWPEVRDGWRLTRPVTAISSRSREHPTCLRRR